VFLKAVAEATPYEVAIVGLFRAAFAGDEGSAEIGKGGVFKGADNDKPACFRLAGFSDAGKVAALGNA